MWRPPDSVVTTQPATSTFVSTAGCLGARDQGLRHRRIPMLPFFSTDYKWCLFFALTWNIRCGANQLKKLHRRPCSSLGVRGRRERGGGCSCSPSGVSIRATLLISESQPQQQSGRGTWSTSPRQEPLEARGACVCEQKHVCVCRSSHKAVMHLLLKETKSNRAHSDSKLRACQSGGLKWTEKQSRMSFLLIFRHFCWEMIMI